ncbi:DUF6339 family protein [Saccharopolyspora flava]|uniref:Uncharacterized protein n=1 Tax=Saccharopolyspora flava TaxID=95161 RepID=A0A1I6QTY5_9PSEU|nr:DUF6339 family protein [Saccharopolyspora flava]SFS55758.1 hypothetical protein SAMN05660874_01850 [Saccharopolyspora flava]
MSLLYPRLLAGQAKPLFEEYSRLSVLELAERVSTRHDSMVYAATGGDRVPESHLLQMREAVLNIAVESGYPEKGSTKDNALFDLRVAEYLHSHSEMMPAEAASGDIWAFLALMVLPDVAYWRYPKPPRDRVLGTDLTRHVFGRMWWRAQLVYTPESTKPYEALTVLGEAAFDQIYARRKALGGSPFLVKAILRVWNELDLTPLRGKITEREALRDFLKRLLRLAPFMLFEALDEEQLDNELRTTVRETVTAIVASTIDPDKVSDSIDAVFTDKSTKPVETRWEFPSTDPDSPAQAAS